MCIFRVSRRVERLNRLLDYIKELESGEYLLMHSGNRMEIFSQKKDSLPEQFDSGKFGNDHNEM
jgi:hydrogenase maturation factor